MKLTVLYGHLEKLPKLSIGQLVNRGDYLCKYGNTGVSTGDHLHLGLIEGVKTKPFRMAEIEPSRNLMTQLAYFIDDELLGGHKHYITSYFGDPNYKDSKGKFVFHSGYDVVSKNRKHKEIYWNRQHQGIVLSLGVHSGYGNYLLMGYDDGIF